MAEGRFNDVVTAITAVLGVVSTAAASYGAWQAILASEQAAAAEAAAKQTQVSFEQTQYRDRQQFELYGKIESLLKESQSGSLVLAATYVSLVGDPQTKAVWCAAVLNYARIRDTELTQAERSAVLYAKQCLTEATDQKAAEQLAGSSAATSTMAAAPVVAAAPAVAPATAAASSDWPDRRVISEGNALGYDIDVFACESGGPRSSAKAKQIADRLAAKYSQDGKIGHALLGQVRLRRLSEAAEARGGYPSGRNQVQADDDESERRIALALGGLASEAAGQPFTSGRSSSQTQFYLSVFACAP